MNKNNKIVVITDAGRALIAALTAAGDPALTLTRIAVGSGVPPDGTTPDELRAYTGLISPFADAASTVPSYDGDTIHFTVEYRNDMNGGLVSGRWLSEFGIYAESPDSPGTPVLFAYATLGKEPQYVAAYGTGSSLDSRRFPVSVTIGAGADVSVRFDTSAFITADDMEERINILIGRLPVDGGTFFENYYDPFTVEGGSF